MVPVDFPSSNGGIKGKRELIPIHLCTLALVLKSFQSPLLLVCHTGTPAPTWHRKPGPSNGEGVFCLCLFQRRGKEDREPGVRERRLRVPGKAVVMVRRREAGFSG